ncbi:hypothetical protein [Clostridium gasigenes]|uniref:Uncharacterized protein n=1 Tax=Clostridium gasigenes TaxID=94869 RepID=A0A1H0NVG1_9CLOT|nr:hypothetical protein [Clostridium gasigenes]MBU3087648.1 hypothetical protein [Clostridium gasigenes]SDO96691.1 hypothetical protein SAMN04488529_101974 [Clostridium gasigenes]
MKLNSKIGQESVASALSWCNGCAFICTDCVLNCTSCVGCVGKCSGCGNSCFGATGGHSEV